MLVLYGRLEKAAFCGSSDIEQAVDNSGVQCVIYKYILLVERLMVLWMGFIIDYCADFLIPWILSYLLAVLLAKS